MYVLGLDLGTSSLKASLADENGRILQTFQEDYSLQEPQKGWKEIDPKVWKQAMEAVFAKLGPTICFQVEAIAITGQMHTIVLLDEAGKPLCPALMWNDLRTKDLIDGLKQTIRTFKKAGHIANFIATGSPAANLYWLKENDPDTYQQIAKILIAPDYLTYLLTGTSCTDACDASTSALMDVNQGIWADEMLNLLGLQTDQLPILLSLNEPAGMITKDYQDRYGFPTDCLVYPATGDNAASALSYGLFDNHKPILSIGTSGVLMIERDQPVFDRKGKNIRVQPDSGPTRYMAQGSISCAGNALSWWLKKIVKENDFDYVLQAHEKTNPLTNPVLFYPHLNGEKTIYANPDLKGTFLQLGNDTTKEEMTMALIEGVAFGFQDLMENMGVNPADLDSIEVTGGGSKSKAWMQTIADVLQVPALCRKNSSSAGQGVINNTLNALGKDQTLHQTDPEDIICYKPNPDLKAHYQKKYAKYQTITPFVKSLQDA